MSPLRIILVTPAPPGSLRGNRVTAERWADQMKRLGHAPEVVEGWRGQPCDVLVALHARRSSEDVRRFRETRPESPLVLALTGTDLYGDLEHDAAARRSLELATRLVVLQERGRERLPAHLRPRVRVIYQSVEAPRPVPPPREGVFEACVLGHMRPVKDPFRAARAAARLPSGSRLVVLHVGAAIAAGMEEEARLEAAVNPRYHWLGSRPRDEALRILGRSRLHVLTSRMEGGANAVCEALALGVPTLSSRIEGSEGILGPDYPGFFPVGDTSALAGLMQKAEEEPAFLEELRRCCDALRPLVAPERERAAWAALLAEVAPAAGS